ncbi:MAG: DivIVA domain-containing protein, partial [Trebonia sp.]
MSQTMYPSPYPYPAGQETDSPLTPQEVREASFSAVRLGRRGFDEGEVRAFCDRMAEELARSLSQRAALEAEVLRLRERVLGRPDAGPTAEDAHVQAVNVLTMAQRTADQYVSDAQEYSRELAQDAHLRHDEILREAQVRASVILDEAHAAAQAAADAIQPSYEPGTAGGGQRENDAELAYLRTFSQVCRTHLRAYLESLSKSIEEWEKTEEQGLAAARGTSAPSAARPSSLSRRQSPLSLRKMVVKEMDRERFQAASASPIGVDGGPWKNGHISSASARQSPVACISASTENRPRLMRC